MKKCNIERFNRVYRQAILYAYLLTDNREVIALTDKWIEEHNDRRSHEALQNRTTSVWQQQI